VLCEIHGTLFKYEVYAATVAAAEDLARKGAAGGRPLAVIAGHSADVTITQQGEKHGTLCRDLRDW